MWMDQPLSHNSASWPEKLQWLAGCMHFGVLSLGKTRELGLWPNTCSRGALRDKKTKKKKKEICLKPSRSLTSVVCKSVRKKAWYTLHLILLRYIWQSKRSMLILLCISKTTAGLEPIRVGVVLLRKVTSCTCEWLNGVQFLPIMAQELPLPALLFQKRKTLTLGLTLEHTGLFINSGKGASKLYRLAPPRESHLSFGTAHLPIPVFLKRRLTSHFRAKQDFFFFW